MFLHSSVCLQGVVLWCHFLLWTAPPLDSTSPTQDSTAPSPVNKRAVRILLKYFLVLRNVFICSWGSKILLFHYQNYVFNYWPFICVVFCQEIYILARLLAHSPSVLFRVTFLPPATKLRQCKCFYTCLWFCSQGGLCPSMHHRSLSPVFVQGGSVSRGSLLGRPPPPGKRRERETSGW